MGKGLVEVQSGTLLDHDEWSEVVDLSVLSLVY